MAKTFATATYQSDYHGDIQADLTPFRTKRGGNPVVRFRWTGQHVYFGGFSGGGFPTVERALAAARAHARFADVQAV